jgi:hypothetical protein
VLGLLLAIAVVGLAVVGYLLAEEREHSRALAGQLVDCSGQRDALAKQSQDLGNQLATASGRLADLRQRGLKIYTFELEVAFSGATAAGGHVPNLAALVTLSSASGAKSYALTNPDLTAALEGDRLRMVFEPVDPSLLIGRDISTLADIAYLRMNVTPLFTLANLQLGETSEMSFSLQINGVTVVAGTSGGAGLAGTTAVSLPVEKLFAGVEGRYAAAIGLPAASEAP